MTESSGDGTDPKAIGSFEQYMEDGPPAFALTSGEEHTLVFANLAFRRLTGVSASDVGRPIADVVRGPNASGLRAVLDRVFRTTNIARDTSIAGLGEITANWRCTVWPQLNARDRPERLVIEMWESSQADLTLALQREVAERMLLSALRERDATDKAERSSRRATFLAAEGRRLTESLDEQATQDAVAGLALPSLAAWCIVDVFDGNGAMHRLQIVHPDPAKQVLLRDLEGRWSPEAGDPFGLPAVVQSREPVVIAADQMDAALVAGGHGPDTLRFLRAIGMGALLTVPLVIRDTVVGAVTFVSEGEGHDNDFTSDDVALAQELAVRSAIALDSAKLHGQALTLKSIAESASRAKTTFLGTVSHELRTPLNAIGGYVDLILLGLRGPVSPAQRVDLERVKSNQRHLVGLITDLLNFVRLGSGRLSYNIVDVPVDDALASAVALVDALIIEKGLLCTLPDGDSGIVARADIEKLQQILINLLSNAIKFTPSGGQITIDCKATDTSVHIHVADTGIGIPDEKLATIFDPFVQVREGFASRDSGIGLGLAISRDLAHAMHGDLGVASALGRGSTFTLVLPRAIELQPQA
ncbi:MAG: GAF domain-containing sensor histidine kinase [Gemmatimonadota bacterium]|nr:GAF domain-containing sensor histidine kinase [Gemmatimonadota bacterium]